MPSDFAITPIRSQQAQTEAVAAAQAAHEAAQQQSSPQSQAQSAGTVSAPSANLDPAPSFHVDSRLGIAVVELQDQKGNIILSMPSQKAITAYLAGRDDSLNPSASVTPTSEGGQTNTTA